MNDEQRIKALDLLTKTEYDLRKDGKKYWGPIINRIFNGLVKETRQTDGSDTVVDFKKKTIVVQTWLESHHNGDLYDEVDHDVPWINLCVMDEPIMELLTKHVQLEIEQEEKKAIKTRARKQAELLLK